MTHNLDISAHQCGYQRHQHRVQLPHHGEWQVHLCPGEGGWDSPGGHHWHDWPHQPHQETHQCWLCHHESGQQSYSFKSSENSSDIQHWDEEQDEGPHDGRWRDILEVDIWEHDCPGDRDLSVSLVHGGWQSTCQNIWQTFQFIRLSGGFSSYSIHNTIKYAFCKEFIYYVGIILWKISFMNFTQVEGLSTFVNPIKFSLLFTDCKAWNVFNLK